MRYTQEWNSAVIHATGKRTSILGTSETIGGMSDIMQRTSFPHYGSVRSARGNWNEKNRVSKVYELLSTVHY